MCIHIKGSSRKADCSVAPVIRLARIFYLNDQFIYTFNRYFICIFGVADIFKIIIITIIGISQMNIISRIGGYISFIGVSLIETFQYNVSCIFRSRFKLNIFTYGRMIDLFFAILISCYSGCCVTIFKKTEFE